MKWSSAGPVFRSPEVPNALNGGVSWPGHGGSGVSASTAGSVSGVSGSQGVKKNSGEYKGARPSVYRSPMIAVYRAKLKTEPKAGKYTKVETGSATRLQALLSPSTAGVKVAIEDAKELEIAMRTKIQVPRVSAGGSDGRASPGGEGVDGFVAI